MLHFHVVWHYLGRALVFVPYDTVLPYKPGSGAEPLYYNVPVVMLRSLKTLPGKLMLLLLSYLPVVIIFPSMHCWLKIVP